MASQSNKELTGIYFEALTQVFLSNPKIKPEDIPAAIQQQIKIEDVEVPEGKNSLSSLEMFEERQFYRNDIYPRSNQAPTPFDLWYNRPFFGKMDTDGDPIVATKDHMVQLSNNVWAFDFVVDAFNDFKNEFLFLNKKAVEGTPFGVLTPERGWTSPMVQYDQYMDFVYDKFVVYVEQYKKDSEMTTFDNFMNLFYRFVEINSPNLPITLSQFVVSPYCSPISSGLMIEISVDSHGNDTEKFNNFINDRNFICYAESAERFGFKIDKNYPGRLIVDINSPVMTREGDSSVPPSQGGEGYMRKYPQLPSLFTKPAPTEPEYIPELAPTQYPDIPFIVGDGVRFAMNHKQGSTAHQYTILRNFTELKNRVYDVGHSARKVDDERVNGVSLRTDAYQLMIGPNYHDVYGGEIVAINPSDTEKRGFGISSSNSDIAIVKVKPSTTYSQWIPRNQDTIKGILLEEFLQNRGRMEIRVYLEGQSTGFEYNNQNPSTVYMEVPLDALHIQQPDPFIIKRFQNTISYPAKLAKWEDNQATQLRIFQSKRRDYIERVLPIWQAEKQQSENAWSHYRNSPRMSAQNIFSKRYNKSYAFDPLMLKEITMQFYHSYVSDNPSAVVSRVIQCGAGTKITKQKVITRQQISQDFMNSQYPDSYWLKQYILIRNAELSVKKTFDSLRGIKRKAFEIYTQDGLNHALRYIKEKMPVLSQPEK